MYQVNVNDLARLYSPQTGRGADSGLAFYKSSYKRQRGAGLGSVLGAIARTLIPIARNILWPAAKKYVLPHATEAARQVAGDVLSGRNVKESLKEHGKGALKGIGKQIISQSGKGRGRRSTKSRKRKATVKTRKRTSKKLLTLF